MNTNAIQTLNLQVYPAADFTVTVGAAEGDALSFADEMVLDDIYALSRHATKQPLKVDLLEDGQKFRIRHDSPQGHAGNITVIDSCLSLMAADSTLVEALVLVEVEDDTAAAIYLLPLAPIERLEEYRLVGLDRHAATTRFAELACVSFTRGTHVTLGSGAQVPVERLKVGDKVLTRDDGPQPIRWIGRMTVRAVGAFAPVVIRKGVLHNANDLVMNPDHRIFIYQREDKVGAGRAEVLIKVRHLIDDKGVFQQDGGFVDYFQLLFDDHQIIYAEGIAAESLLVDPRTAAALPQSAIAPVSEGAGSHRHRHHLDYEIQDSLLTGSQMVDLLKRASSA